MKYVTSYHLNITNCLRRDHLKLDYLQSDLTGVVPDW